MPALAGAAPSHRSSTARHDNLPAPLSTFIGREKEVADIRRLLMAVRLVTLTGPGGCGKTTLALHVARELLDVYAGGVVWVDLAPLADPALLPQSVATALGLGEQPAHMFIDVLSDLIRDPILLVVDNCEHLIDACALLTTQMLQECPGLHMLTTSREPLNVAGEVAWLVPSLQLPNPDAHSPLSNLQQVDAVRLFTERASAVQSDFTLTEQNAAVVARICRRLDGIPLAIELAAARVKVLSVEQIAARLDDALRLLADGTRTAGLRHQTMRATLDWSHELLSAAERILFRRLSAFEGGCDLEAVESVCAGDGLQRDDVLSTLTRLIDRSLLVKHEADREARYRLLEPVRQYSREKLSAAGELNAVRGQHFKYFLSLAEKADLEMTGRNQIEWSRRLERTHDNLRAALRWAVESEEGDLALRLCLALVQFWAIRGYIAQGRHWLDQALELARAQGMQYPSGAARLRYGRLLNWAGFMAATQGDLGAARAFGETGLSLLRESGDQPGIAFALFSLANSVRQQGDYAAACDLYVESLSLFRQLGDKWYMALALNSLGRVARSQNDYAAARALFEEGLALARELGDEHSLTMSLRSLQRLAHAQGDYVTARALGQETLALKQESGDKFGIAISFSSLGHVVLAQRDHGPARQLLLEGLLLLRDLGVKRDVAHNLVGWASLALATGQPLGAAKLAGAVQALLEAIGARLDEPEHTVYKDAIAGVRAELDPAAFNAAWEAGRQMNLEKAIAAAEQVTVAPSALAASAKTAPHDPNALTPRELEVLRLLAGGLTDARIADKLVISRRTVNTHLMSIYGKLGVNSRVAATRYALDHKLI